MFGYLPFAGFQLLAIGNFILIKDEKAAFILFAVGNELIGLGFLFIGSEERTNAMDAKCLIHLLVFVWLILTHSLDLSIALFLFDACHSTVASRARRRPISLWGHCDAEPTASAVIR